MTTFSLSVPCLHTRDAETDDFGTILELARQHAHALDRVVFIDLQGARIGYPNRWAVSPKGYVSVEGVQMPQCVGCGD
jgi:hypothetical protein